MAVVVAILVGFMLLISLGFPSRPDYVAHFAAGAGATMMGLAVITAVVRRPHPGFVLALGVAAIGMGAAAEATVFRLAAFDPVDFGLQSSGAAIATTPFMIGGALWKSAVSFIAGLLVAVLGVLSLAGLGQHVPN